MSLEHVDLRMEETCGDVAPSRLALQNLKVFTSKLNSSA